MGILGDIPAKPKVEQSNFMGKNAVRISESGLRAMEEYERKRQEAEEAQNQEPIINLASDLRSRWQAAYNSKQSSGVEEKLFQCLRQRRSQYDPDKLAKIRAAGRSEVFMNLTNVKCRSVEAWIREVELPPGDKPWGLSETPIPTLPKSKDQEISALVLEETVQIMMMQGIDSVNEEQIQRRMEEIQEKVQKEKREYAEKQAQKIETQIEDELREGGYYEAVSCFIKDVTTYPAAFLKGPVVRRKKKLVWTEDQNGDMVPAIEIQPVKEYYSPSPFDMYPSPGARNVQDGYLFERHRLRRSDVVAMIGVEGFSEDAIRGVLHEYGRGGLREWLSVDQERAEAMDRPHEQTDPEAVIDCLEYWGSALGSDLLEWGMPAQQIPDPDLDYQVTAWMIGRWVVMARINPHPTDQRPYYCASYDADNNAIWNSCPPMLMKSTQDICNATARALVDNLAISSGPQVEVYMDRLDPSENPDEMYPWKRWKMKDSASGTSGRAINFYQPNSLADVLLKVYQYFFEQASEQTGIPTYMHGSQEVGGAGKTASGLTMLMNAASKTLKGVIAHIDEKVIIPSIKNHWLNIMLFNDDIQKTGDINVIARASEHLIIQEQLQMRRTEALDRITGSQHILDIIGREGLAEVLRDYFTGLKMNTKDIVPDEMEIAQPPPMIVPPQGIPPEQGGVPQNIPSPAIIDQAGNQKGVSPGNLMRRPALGA